MAVNPLLVGGIGVGVTAVAVTGGLYAGGVIGGSGNQQVSTQNGTNEDQITNMPGWKPASDDSDQTTAYTDNKYASKYKKYLVAVNLTGENVNANDGWWDWSYQYRFQKELGEKKGKFKNVKSGRGTGISLKSICAEAYKAETGSGQAIITDTTTTIDDNKFKESDIWKYCSPSETKIETLKSKTGSSAYDNGQYGKEENNRAELVYADSETDNKWFWDLKEKELKEAQAISNTSSEFKKFQDKLLNPTSSTASSKTSLREVCKEAYGQAVSDDSSGSSTAQYPKSEVFKYCSLNGTTTTTGSTG